ncbi:MAG: DUF4838 domain-containing protein, partial [Candidatus Hydrogenedentes bacterium]|nr:DUF4838 domain-containing protein [Candidatus Hydrogenedentota bacterium]
ARERGLCPPPETLVRPHPDWRNALAPKGAAGPELTLATAGKTDYAILLPETPTTQEEKAAADVALWLDSMTHAAFPILWESGGEGPAKAISVGRTARLAASGLPEAAADLGGEGYGIAVKGDTLFLWGGDTRGPVNAVYALLEEDLGCRWYHRGSVTIPDAPTLTLRPVPRTFAPVLEIRDPFYWDAFDATWSLRNRTNAPSARVPDAWGGRMDYVSGYFVHTYGRLVPPDKYFDEHPEYYSEINGKRVPRQLCVTNPDVVRIAIENVLEALRNEPRAELISVSPNDGTGYCDCERCRALDEAEGSKSASLIQFVNAVADAVKDEFPNVKISTLAYLDTVQPPKTIRPRENVAIRLCTDRHAWSHQFEFVTETQEFQTALRAWADIGATIHIWDYTVNYSHYSIPMPNMPIVTQNMRFLIDHNVRGIMLQGAYQSPGSARGPMRCWVWGKQLWDPKLNTRALIRDFTYGFYGAAAEPMHEYDELCWRTWELEHLSAMRADRTIRYPPTAKFITPEFVETASALFERAEALAGDGETLRRVQLAKLAILYLKAARGPAEYRDYARIIDEFEAIATREHVTHLWEGGGAQVAEKIEYWRGLEAAQTAEMSALEVGDVWQFKPDPDNVGVEQAWFARDVADLDWARVRCDIGQGWESQGFAEYTGYGWYRARFDVPAAMEQAPNLILFFAAVDEDAEVYINGRRAFEHTCESTGLTPDQIWNRPFAFDPREYLKFGEENLIAVRVYNRFAMGGIYKPVHLIRSDKAVKPDYLEDLIRGTE